MQAITGENIALKPQVIAESGNLCDKSKITNRGHQPLSFDGFVGSVENRGSGRPRCSHLASNKPEAS